MATGIWSRPDEAESSPVLSEDFSSEVGEESYQGEQLPVLYDCGNGKETALSH